MNIIPLCALCHDKAPDVKDAEEIWRWVASEQNGLSGLGAGHLKPLVDTLISLCGRHSPSLEECDRIEKEIFALASESASRHLGQFGQGGYLKSSTLDWVIREAFQKVLGQEMSITSRKEEDDDEERRLEKAAFQKLMNVGRRSLKDMGPPKLRLSPRAR